MRLVPVSSPIFEAELQLKGSVDVRLYRVDMVEGFVSVIVSKDPSGKNGELEDHVSMQWRREREAPRKPSWKTIKAICKLLGWDEILYPKSNTNTAHIYRNTQS